jgi:hypothetical protein
MITQIKVDRERWIGRFLLNIYFALRMLAARLQSHKLKFHIVTSHADADDNKQAHPNTNLENASYTKMINLLFRSAEIFCPEATFAVITSQATKLDGIGLPFSRHEFMFRPEFMMYDRALAQLEFLKSYNFRRSALFLDSDMLINGSLAPFLRNDYDVAFSWRNVEEMPINGGLIVVNNRRPDAVIRFFSRYVNIFTERYLDRAQWYGDQLALRDAVGFSLADVQSLKETIVISSDNAKVLIVPSSLYNYFPPNKLNAIISPIPRAAIVHFKGGRKRLMERYWDAHLAIYADLISLDGSAPREIVKSFKARKYLVNEARSEG